VAQVIGSKTSLPSCWFVPRYTAAVLQMAIVLDPNHGNHLPVKAAHRLTLPLMLLLLCLPQISRIAGGKRASTCGIARPYDTTYWATG